MAQQQFRNAYHHPLTIAEQIAHAHIGTLRDTLVAREIAFCTGIAEADVTPLLRCEYQDGNMDEGCTCVVWLRHYRPMRPAPEPEWPQPSIDLVTLEGDDNE